MPVIFSIARYGVALENLDAVGVIEHIAVRRAYRLKGGAPDFEKAAHTLLQDYRSGALGRISLETPTNRIALLASYQPPPSLAEPQEVHVDDESD